jgi:thiol peroxidase
MNRQIWPERKGVFQIAGRDVTLVGNEAQIGDQAPEFIAQTQDWQPIPILASTEGKVRILAAVPSLNTSVCDRETRRFNEEASALSEDIVIIVISMDLPYAQKQWCGAAGVDRVLVVSDHMEADFGKKYGCLIKERRILRRSVFVVDRKGKITYAAYMPEQGQEPDYLAVIHAAKDALMAQ